MPSDSYAKYGKKYYEANKAKYAAKKASWKQEHREQEKEYQRKYHEDHKEQYKARRKERYDETRKAFLEMYGGKCSCCEESEERFLVIDHINGQIGVKNKDTATRAYVKALKKYDPATFRILCHNCNMATRFGETCPHQKGKTK